MNNHNLSNGNSINSDNTIIEFNVRRKIASACNRLMFLKKCINEKVLPKSAPPHLRHDLIPFTESGRAYWGIPGQIDQRMTPSYFQKI